MKNILFMIIILFIILFILICVRRKIEEKFTEMSLKDYQNLMLNNNWINQMHTHVPGHDGNISFGGACFPKDINALNQFMISNNSDNNILNSTIIEQQHIRKE